MQSDCNGSAPKDDQCRCLTERAAPRRRDRTTFPSAGVVPAAALGGCWTHRGWPGAGGDRTAATAGQAGRRHGRGRCLRLVSHQFGPAYSHNDTKSRSISRHLLIDLRLGL